jgi:hypothetical protein
MGTEQLYFIIGFLLGVLVIGCLSVLCFILYNEWIKHDKPKISDDIFD